MIIVFNKTMRIWCRGVIPSRPRTPVTRLSRHMAPQADWRTGGTMGGRNDGRAGRDKSRPYNDTKHVLPVFIVGARWARLMHIACQFDIAFALNGFATCLPLNADRTFPVAIAC